MQTIQEVADKLLWPCWRGMPEGYKMKYARNIWQQFEDNIRSAAYTSSLPKFFESLCRKLGITIRATDTEMVAAAITGADQRAALRMLREETTAAVLLCRLKNEEKKEQFRKEREDRENVRISRRDDGFEFDLA